jgi:hypothetical protein
MRDPINRVINEATNVEFTLNVAMEALELKSP